MNLVADLAHCDSRRSVAVQRPDESRAQPLFPGRRPIGKHASAGGSVFSALTLEIPCARGKSTSLPDNFAGQRVGSEQLGGQGAFLQTSAAQNEMASESVFDALALDAPLGRASRRRRNRNRGLASTSQRTAAAADVVPAPTAVPSVFGQVAQSWQPRFSDVTSSRTSSVLGATAPSENFFDALALSAPQRRPRRRMAGLGRLPPKNVETILESSEEKDKDFGRGSSIDTECSTMAATVDGMSEPVGAWSE